MIADAELVAEIATDPFHLGAAACEQFLGFSDDSRVDPCEVRPMSDEEIAEARARIDGATRSSNRPTNGE